MFRRFSAEFPPLPARSPVGLTLARLSARANSASDVCPAQATAEPKRVCDLGRFIVSKGCVEPLCRISVGCRKNTAF